MKKKSLAILAGCVVLAVVTGTSSISAQSNKSKSGIATEIPGAGISTSLENCSIESEEERAEFAALVNKTALLTAENPEAEEVVTLEEKSTEQSAEQKEETTTQAAKETEKPTETTTVEPTTEEETTKPVSYYDTIAMSQVDDYVNVRVAPNTDAEIVGKIFNNCAADIISKEGDWYQIKSGNVSGYIKAEYFITGEAAEKKALELRNIFATVNTSVLNVREGQSTDSQLLTQVNEGEKLDVINYGDGWAYVAVDADVNGWVSMDYVTLSVEWNTAITLEEEQQKIEEERRRAEEAAAAEEAARKAAEAQRRAEEEAQRRAEEARREEENQSYDDSDYEEEYNDYYVETSTSDSVAALRQAVVSYAEQFEGNPYVYGGTSLTNGTDCSGFTMSVYQHFGYNLNRTSSSQPYSDGAVAVDIYDLEPGDLLFYSNGGSGIGHVALYIGGGEIIHASTPQTGIKISNAYYRTPICAARVIY